METMRLVEGVVYLKLDPADIARMKIEVPFSGDYAKEGFASEAEFVAEVERAARSCLMVIWSNGKIRAGEAETAQ